MGIDLSKHAALGEAYTAAKASVSKYQLGGLLIPVYLCLDHSGSMRGYFRNGSVQHLAERILALAAHFDDDGIVPVVLFDTYARKPAPISVTAYAGSIDRINANAGPMGSTDYVAAMQAVRRLHAHAAPGQPGLVIFQTDGAPDSKPRTERELCDAAREPLFWQFVGFGDEGDTPPGEGARFDFLRKLSDLAVPKKRPVDNAGFFPAGADPRTVPDDVLYDNLLGEVPDWLAAYGQYAGIGTHR